ncbi:MAG: SpoIIE family protein phosphatase [Terracidiphilus sp.]
MKSTVLLALSLIISTCGELRAQDTSANVVRVMLGDSVAALTGPWKFHTGDNPQWAGPDFDDSAWTTMDLTPPAGSFDPMGNSSSLVSGWTGRGSAGYSGYAWYRLRVNVQDGVQSPSQGADAALALEMPDDVDDAYQVYVNGQLIGQFGRFAGHSVTWYYPAQFQAFPLPANIRSGSMTIAIRVWMDVSEPFRERDAGGLRGVPVLGRAPVINALLHLERYAHDRTETSMFLGAAIELMALMVALGLYWLDREDPAYLWLGLNCMANLSYVVFVLIGNYTTWIAAPFVNLLRSSVSGPLGNGLWVLFWVYWFRLGGIGLMAWLYRAVWGLVLLLGIGRAMQQPPLYVRLVPAHAIVWLSPLTSAFNLSLGVLLVWVLYLGIRRDRTEGWLALPAVTLLIVARFPQVLAALHMHQYFRPFGMLLPFDVIANYITLGLIMVMTLRRFLHGQQERARIQTELQQARGVQEMLIPKVAAQVPGFRIESVYLPASEVSGDFFQVLPQKDGALLLVIGDVSGKGLKAAMTVSAIIGALRGCTLRDPAEVLAYLSRTLRGQISGFVTCGAALITPDGELVIANAGHLSPYRNGEELPVNSGLPLGIDDEVAYSEITYHLGQSDRLTFVSDGVVEARNAKGEIYGFERTRAISSQPAQQIAQAAQNFGQDDDITVLTLARTA